MEKVKQIALRLEDNIKANFKEYKITNIIILLVTLLLVIGVENEFFQEDILGKITLFGTISAVATFFVETLGTTKKKTIFGYGISFIIGLVFTFLCYAEDEVLQETSIRVLVGYMIAVLAGSVFARIKKKKVSMSNYFFNAFHNLLKTVITYFVLNIGIMIVTGIFMLLILEHSKWETILRIQIALAGFYFIPSVIRAITNIENQENKFTKGLVLYVLLPLTSIAMLIIYLYMAKILILWQIPSNAIFRILAGIFVIGFPIYRMACVYKEEYKWVHRITNILPWAFIPFLFLQIYSVGVRCIGYGMTPLRYLCWMLVIYEIIAIVLVVYKKQKRAEYTWIGLIVLAILSTMTPWNMISVSNQSQARILKKAWEEGREYEELTKEEKQKAKGAYQYLSYHADAEKYIPSYLSEEDLENLKPSYRNSKIETEYIYYNEKEKEELDITEYSKMKRINEFYNEDEIPQEYQEMIQNIVEQYDTNKTSGENYLKQNKRINITETEDLYIKEISIRYEKEDKQMTIKSCRIEGYQFKK